MAHKRSSSYIRFVSSIAVRAAQEGEVRAALGNLKPDASTPLNCTASLAPGPPSLYEGFGLPVLEAMTLGTPVITSTTSSLGELAGDAAMLADPTDIDDVARAMQKFDADEDLRNDYAKRARERAKDFSPGIYCKRAGDLYRSLLS
jgi:Glycosyl transferases group 1